MEKIGPSSQQQSISKKYTCYKCKKSYTLNSMYACYHGHHMCKVCYQKVKLGKQINESTSDFGSGSDVQDIPRTTSFFGQVPEMNSATVQRQRFMFPNPSIFQQNTLDCHNSLISLATMCRPSLLSFGVSRKPIICPQYDCRKTVAVSSLDAHFHHEHKQVATIVTQLETRNCLEFNFKDLRGKKRNMCLVLISLEDEFSQELDSTQKFTESRIFRHCQNQQKPFFILIVAKMPYGVSEELNEDPMDFEYKSHERVYFYVTSNVIGSYSYTIAISTPTNNSRIKYFGPLLSVNDDYRKLCDEGKGLVLNHYDINGMSNGGRTPVNLDLIIHEREDHSLDDCIK